MTAGSTSYSRIADRYEAVRGGADRARQLVGPLASWLRPDWTVCDVGAGTGIVSAELGNIVARVVGVDLSPEMIRQAKERLHGRVLVGDAQALPLPSGSVDAVTFVWVLHLVGDPAAAIGEAARVLRPGGRAVVVWARPRPPAPGQETEVDRILGGMQSALGADFDDRVAAVTAGVRQSGLRQIADETLTVEYQSSIEDLAAAVEQRLFAHLWDLDDATWAKVVQPRIDALRQLPDARAPVRRAAVHPLWVYER